MGGVKLMCIQVENPNVAIQLVPPCFGGKIRSLSIASKETGDGSVALCDGVPNQFYSLLQNCEGVQSNNVDVNLENNIYFVNGLFLIANENVQSFEIEFKLK